MMNVQIEHRPGSTYDENPFAEQRTAEEAAHERAEKRIHAVEQFKRSMQATTRAQLDPLLNQMLGLCLQLRSCGGSGVETDIPNRLRECADFLEDL